MGNHRPARTVLDPLFAKVVVFESGDQRLCLAALDVTIITGDYTAKIRSAISEKTGVPPAAILVHATQTHSAPSVGHFVLDPDFTLATTPETEYLRGCESEYADFAADAVVHAAVEAADQMQPVRLGYGRAMLSDLAFNRRGIRRDGTVVMPKPLDRDTDLCYLEGPMDPEVGVLCVQGADAHVVALLLHYTCHPVNVFGHQETYRAVSADWPGAWAREMCTALGSDVVPLVLNGCCGNINPWHPFDPDCRPDHRRMGRDLGSMAQKVIQYMTFSEDDTLQWTVRHVPLAYRDIPPKRQQEVAEILKHNPCPPRGENGEVDPRWFRAASTRSVELCRRREPEFPYEVQVFRIGDLAVVGLPGEPFVEGQLDIKVGSTAPYTLAAHATTQFVGYLPTRQAYTRGGHEANEDVTYWAKLAPGSLETVSETAVATIEELFP